MKKLLLLIIIPFNLLAQTYYKLPINNKIIYNDEILSGSCISPDGSIKQIFLPPSGHSYLLANGYCGYTYSTTTSFTACFTLTSPGTAIDFNAGYSSNCATISFSNFKLFNSSCVQIGTGLSYTGLTPGATYTWCLNMKASGGGPTCTGFNTFCPYYQDMTPLPLEWSNLKAKLDNNKVILTWSTYSESNTSKFLIERTVDTSFVVLDKIYAQGYSSFTTNYEYIDTAPLNDISYYRVIEVDKDNKQFKSNIVAVNNKQYTIDYIECYNILGQLVSNDLDEMSDGVYIFKYYNKGELINIKKIIK